MKKLSECMKRLNSETNSGRPNGWIQNKHFSNIGTHILPWPLFLHRSVCETFFKLSVEDIPALGLQVGRLSEEFILAWRLSADSNSIQYTRLSCR